MSTTRRSAAGTASAPAGAAEPIYDLAASLYGYAARGDNFLHLRAELRRLFGIETA